MLGAHYSTLREAYNSAHVLSRLWVGLQLLKIPNLRRGLRDLHDVNGVGLHSMTHNGMMKHRHID